jgi:SpoVK/Ycf46/Vps4 family AAA+-type ATPase
MFERKSNVIVDQVGSRVFDFGLDILKTRLSIPLKISSDSVDYKKYIELLKRIDKKFNKHVINVDNKQYIDGVFIINTNNNAKIIVYGYPKINTERDSSIVYYLDMYIIGSNSLAILNKIKEFIKKSDKKGSESLTLYEISGNDNGWISIKSFVDKRGFDTLFFNDNICDEIMEHIDNWNKCDEVFKERGLIHKTGILVYGKAGTGKSTLAKALASELDYSLVSIDTSTFDDINLIELTNAINNDNMNVVVFIDEIDAIFKSRDDDTATDDQKVRVTKLLSFLDGVNSPNNCIFVATTNFYDRLDKALTRKGRFDKVIELTDINKDAAMQMCKSFGLSDEASENVIRSYKTKSINPADLQDKIITVIRKELNEAE